MDYRATLTCGTVNVIVQHCQGKWESVIACTEFQTEEASTPSDVQSRQGGIHLNKHLSWSPCLPALHALLHPPPPCLACFSPERVRKAQSSFQEQNCKAVSEDGQPGLASARPATWLEVVSCFSFLCLCLPFFLPCLLPGASCYAYVQ